MAGYLNNPEIAMALKIAKALGVKGAKDIDNAYQDASGVQRGATSRVLGTAELGTKLAQAMGINTGNAREDIANAQNDLYSMGANADTRGKIAEFAGDPLLYVGGPSAKSALSFGALSGATSGTGSADSTLRDNALNAAVGGVVGMGGNSAARAFARISKGASDKITPEVKQAVERLRDQGVNPRLSQIVDSKVLRNVDAVLPNIPFSGANASQNAQKQAFTEQLAGTFGAKDLSTDSLSAAKQALSGEYDNLLANHVAQIDRAKLGQDIANQIQQLSLQTDQSGVDILSKQANNIMGNIGQNGEMAGKTYQAVRRSLKGARGKEYGVRELQTLLDDAYRAGSGEDIAQQLGAIDGKYKNFKIAESVGNQAQNADASFGGAVNPSSVYNVAKQSIPDIGTGGGGEFGQLTRDGRLLRQTVPDSGSAGRLITTAGLAGTAGAGTYVGTQDKSQAAAAALATMGLGYGGNKLMNSRLLQNYAMNGLAPDAIQAGLTGIANSGIPGQVAANAATSQNAPQQQPQYDPNTDPEVMKLLGQAQPQSYNPEADPDVMKLLNSMGKR